MTTRNQQVARIDYESDRRRVAERSKTAWSTQHSRGRSRTADVVLVSDYQKGAVTRAVARAAIEAARTRGIPSLVDPKVPHIDYYAGATLITPNHHEAEAVTLMRIRTAADARAPRRSAFASAPAARACWSRAASTACGCSGRTASTTCRPKRAKCRM